MATRKATADPKQGFKIIGAVLLIVALLGYAVLPMMDPGRSRLIGTPAPDFTLPVAYNGEPGSRIALRDLRGQAVVVDFWASWCAPCRAQAPVIDRVARRHEGHGVVVLGVSTSGDDWASAVRFAQSHNLRYTTLFDDGSKVGNAYRVQVLPTLVIIDQNGTIRAVHTRVIGEAELEKLIQEARAEATEPT